MRNLAFRLAAACAIAAWGALAAGCGGHSSAIPPPSAPIAGPEEPAPPVMPQSVGSPTHVALFTYWQQSGMATQVPASWMAQWATYIETGASIYANEFHAAGGKYAVAYTDPNYFFTSSSWTSPGHYAESAFGHHSG